MEYDSFGSAVKRGFMRMPVIIRSIILVNVVVFLIQMIGGNALNGWLVRNLGYDPAFPTFLTQPWRLITYQFLHANFFHVLFNMLWLWWMGVTVEKTIGPRSFAIVYFAAGILGAFTQSALALIFGFNLVIGASGAVTGVLVAFAMLFPNAPIMLFLFPPIPARFFVAGWVALDVLLLGTGDNVARLVHIGGALAGYLAIKAYKQGADLSMPIRYIEYLFGKYKPQGKSEPRNKNMHIVSDAEIIEETDQSEIDAILEKISKEGYDALTKEEKRKLFELSKRN